jgi:hypothetical protein
MYTSGRLIYQEDSDVYTHILRDVTGNRIIHQGPQDSRGEAEANARRLAACWNVCDGLETADLEVGATLGDICADRNGLVIKLGKAQEKLDMARSMLEEALDTFDDNPAEGHEIADRIRSFLEVK